ncbi:MAG: anaerobic ribonucleoside-triphosphate reductase activating protein [Alkalispirochaetaceae bacterium]
MRVGLQKTTLADYPGHVAATLFTHGCPLRCPYCHNPELVTGPEPEEFLDELAVLAFLDRRKKILQGVCITGGEPLLHPELPRLINRIRSLGLKVKLDTSGVFPERLSRLLEAGYLDYVAVDIKTTPDRYPLLNGSSDRILESVEALRGATVEYELRATAAPGFVDEAYAKWVSEFLLPEERFYLQQYRPGTTLDPRFSDVRPYTPDEMEALREPLAKKERHAFTRGA